MPSRLGLQEVKILNLLLMPLILMLFSSPAAAAAERVALVIGAGDYGRPGEVGTLTSLRQPVEDAEAMFAKLRQLQFDAGDAPLLNPKKTELEAALRAFRVKAQGARVALIYFSGHGATINGTSYVIPTDLRIPVGTTASGLADQSVKLLLLSSALTASQVNLMIVDACRDEPQFTRPLTKSLLLVADDVGTGVAEPQAVRGTTGLLMAFAAAPGSPAYEAAAGRNSMFTAALLEKIDDSGIELRQSLQQAAARVYRQSRGKQEPWIAGSMAQEFYFRPVEKPGPNWILSDNGQCRLQNIEPKSGEKVYWTGACVSGLGSGPGVLLWTRNGAFSELDEGKWQGGFMVGPASIRFASGVTNTGTMKLGRWDGPVTTTDPDGKTNTVIYRDGASVDPSAAGKVGLVLCNSGSEDAFFAYASRNGAQYTVRGWWSVSAKDCRTLIGQRLPDESYYFFAQNRSGKRWHAGPNDAGRVFCVDVAHTFELAENAPCNPGAGELVKLSSRQPHDGLLTWKIIE